MVGIFEVDLEGWVGKTGDTDEYSFYDPDRPEEHRHHDIGSDLAIAAKYNTSVYLFGFATMDDDYNKIM